MKPFNIKINDKGKEVTLTILPELGYYKVIYYGAIVGALKNIDTDWELVPEGEIEPGDLPMYDHQQSYNDDQPPLKLNLLEINQIAAEIENFAAKA